MTIEQRLEQLELQNQRIERKNRRLTAALMVMAVAICAVVTMVATGEKDGDLDVVWAKTIFVTNEAGKVVVGLGADGGGNGLVTTHAPSGKELVALGSTREGTDTVRTFAPNGKKLVALNSTSEGNGTVKTFAPSGKELVALDATVQSFGRAATHGAHGKELAVLGSNGMVRVFNKTGEMVVQMYADESGNGLVGAYNREGVGRALKPGP